MKPGVHLSPAEQAERIRLMKAALAAGHSLTEFAAACGVSPAAAHRFMYRHYPKAAETLADNGRRKLLAAYQAKAARSNAWTPAQTDLFCEMWQAGATLEDICERTGRTLKAVKSRRIALGLPPRAPRQSGVTYRTTERQRRKSAAHNAAKRGETLAEYAETIGVHPDSARQFAARHAPSALAAMQANARVRVAAERPAQPSRPSDAAVAASIARQLNEPVERWTRAVSRWAIGARAEVEA